MNITEPLITLHGNLTARPEIRFLDSGVLLTEFTVASNPRYFDSKSGEWRAGETVFTRCKAWRELGEGVGESLSRGDRVTVVGRLRRRRWRDEKADTDRWLDEVEADDVAASCRGQRVRVSKFRPQRNQPKEAEQESPTPEMASVPAGGAV